MNEKRNLPAIQDLYEEKDVELLKKENDLNVLLNQQPLESWIKQHPIATKQVPDGQGGRKTVPLAYIPIERIEWLLTRIFINWRVEVKDLKLIGNSIVCTVRLHYQSVTDGEWIWQDGIGASPLQTDKGAGAIEFDKLKNSAVMIAAPAAESYAVKDAAEKIGKLFGKDLNRADQVLYDSLLNTFADEKSTDLLLAMKKVIDGLDHYKGKDLDAIKKQCIEHQRANTFTIEFAKEIGAKIGVEI